jgi:hypothetical protein
MRQLPVVDRASEIFLPPMEQKDNTNDDIWPMEKRGSPVQINAARLFDVIRGNGAPIFARDASLFGLQSNRQIRKIVYIFHA